jgi:ribosomal protein L3 glutamine methyltransferase
VKLIDAIERMAARLQSAAVVFGHGTTNAFDEAAWLVMWRLGWPPDALEEIAERQLDAEEMAGIEALIDQRIRRRVPAAYLTGEAWLQGVPFFVDERSIVPRSLIAEVLAEGGIEALLLAEPTQVLDLCTGNGSLAVLAALAWPEAKVLATDLSADALAVAERNVQRHDLAACIELRQGDGLDALRADETFDLVLCNPPYVNAASMATLPPEYRAEPALALAGGRDGMDFVRLLLGGTAGAAGAAGAAAKAGVAAHLRPAGALVLEIGHERAHFEAAFPALAPTWLATQTTDDQVLMLQREQLEGVASAGARPLRRGAARP